MNCDKVRNLMAEYIGQALDDTTKEKIAGHIDKCDNCFVEIKKLDRTIWALECDSRAVKTSTVFLDDMEEKVLSDIKPHFKVRIPKKVLNLMAAVAFAAALVLAFILFVPLNIRYKVYNAATFGKIYSTDDGTFGRRINISSTSGNVKITAAKIAADDMGTDIYFKVGDQSGEYHIDSNTIFVKEKLMLQKNIGGGYRGIEITTQPGGFILQLSPVEDGTKVLHLSFSRIVHLAANGQTNSDVINGQWSFAIPVEKLKSLHCKLNKEVKAGDYELQFKNLTVGTTGTYLEYEYQDKDLQKTFGGFYKWEITCGKQVFQPQAMSGNSNGGKNLYTVEFKSIYTDLPNKIALNIRGYYEIKNYSKPIIIPVSISGQFPMEFKYNGNTITLTNLKDKNGNVQFDMVEPDGQRNYDYLNISIEDADGVRLGDKTDTQKYYVVDENGTQYNYDDVIKNYTKYGNKFLHIYSVDTIYGFRLQNPVNKYFNLAIYGSGSLIMFNKTITLR